jgi:hypothetical protein
MVRLFKIAHFRRYGTAFKKFVRAGPAIKDALWWGDGMSRIAQASTFFVCQHRSLQSTGVPAAGRLS